MTRPMGVFVAVLLTAALAIPTSVSAGPATGKTKAKLDRGDIIVIQTPVNGSAYPRTKTFAVIDAPAAAIWAMVTDCDNLKKNLGLFASSELVSKRGNVSRCKVAIDLPLGMGQLESVTEATDTVKARKHVRKWDLVSGDYSTNHGTWTLVPFDDSGSRTLLVHDAHVVPNISIPEKLATMGQKMEMKKMVRAIRSKARGLTTASR